MKEMIQCATLRIPEGMKNAVSISIAFCPTFSSEINIELPRNAKQKTV